MKKALLIAGMMVTILTAAMGTEAAESERLIGRILKVKTATYISAKQLISEIAEYNIIMIGERHGRKAHQGREAFILAALAERKRYPSVVMEMLTHRQTEAVNRYRHRSPEYAMGMGVALQWWKSDWPDWSYYFPVFQTAFAAKLPLYGADLTDQERKNFENSPIRALPDNDPRLLSWRKSMKNAHCGLIEEDRLENLSNLQVIRDRMMANTLEQVAGFDSGAVLIAGSAHVRKDRSVPTHLANADNIVSVALIEVRADETMEEHLPVSIRAGVRPFDYVWFTPRADKRNFCDQIGYQEEK